MNSALKLIAAAAPLVFTVGCASLTTSNESQVRVETVDAAGVEVKDASCFMARGGVRSEFKTPAVVAVSKGSSNVMIDCSKPGSPDGKAVLTSRVGAATFGNILVGGFIGAAVDQATGKAYNYPDWIQIVMGKLLSFDRTHHVDGKPMAGKPVDGQPVDIAMPAGEMKKSDAVGTVTDKPKMVDSPAVVATPATAATPAAAPVAVKVEEPKK